MGLGRNGGFTWLGLAFLVQHIGCAHAPGAPGAEKAIPGLKAYPSPQQISVGLEAASAFLGGHSVDLRNCYEKSVSDFAPFKEGEGFILPLDEELRLRWNPQPSPNQRSFSDCVTPILERAFPEDIRTAVPGVRFTFVGNAARQKVKADVGYVVPGKFIEGPPPRLSRRARAELASGLMLAMCWLTTEGRLEACQVLKSIPLIDAEVLAAIASWKMLPARFLDQVVETNYIVPVRVVAGR